MEATVDEAVEEAGVEVAIDGDRVGVAGTGAGLNPTWKNTERVCDPRLDRGRTAVLRRTPPCVKCCVLPPLSLLLPRPPLHA